MGNRKITFVDPSTRKLSLLMTDDERDKKTKEWNLEDFAKLLKLCEEYGIPYSDDLSRMWYSLALALARQYRPAPKKRGAYQKWHILNEGALVVEVERRIKQKGTGSSVKWACRQLAKEEPWRSFVGSKEGDAPSLDPGEVLRGKYQKFCSDKKMEVFRKVYLSYAERGDLQGWNDYLHSVVKKKQEK
jgi:hypothetical protein